MDYVKTVFARIRNELSGRAALEESCARVLLDGLERESGDGTRFSIGIRRPDGGRTLFDRGAPIAEIKPVYEIYPSGRKIFVGFRAAASNGGNEIVTGVYQGTPEDGRKLRDLLGIPADYLWAAGMTP